MQNFFSFFFFFEKSFLILYSEKVVHVPKISNRMKTIGREQYLSQLISGRENGLVKVITGIRRCGKSYLLFNIFRNYLTSQGVDDAHIIEISFDDLWNDELADPHKLLAYIRNRMTDNQLYFILLDEVQMLDNFVGVLNSLLHLRNADVYVTGSNSRFLSSDIATEFRGRGDEIRLYPLSFSEYFSAYNGDKADAWRDYFTYGSLPHILALETRQKKVSYLHNLYNTVYKKDLVERNKIKKTEEFDQLVNIMASSIGSPCNPHKLANTFKSVENVDLSADTINNYLSYMQDAFLLERAIRFDIKGKRYIGSLPKYYFIDTGLRNSLLDFRQLEESHIMENVIYNELRMRGFLVDVGMVETRSHNGNGGSSRKQLEVDFVVNMGSKRYYIQSAMSIPDSEKMRQETASLNLIPDSFRKIVIVKDNIVPWHNENGILFISLFDFLLNSNSMDE